MPMKNPVHPGKIVKTAITEGLKMTITEAADGLGVSRQQLTSIVNCRAGISPNMAIRLEKGIGSTAAAWLRMQSAFDLSKEKPAKIKVKKLTPA